MDLVATLRRTSQLILPHRYEPLRCLHKRAPAEEGKRLSGIRLSSAHMQLPEADCKRTETQKFRSSPPQRRDCH